MAKQKPDMSFAIVVQYKASGLDKIYRHNERRNESYGNENVITEMSRYNIHFKDPGDETYTEIFRRLETEGVISTRGLREDATLLDEIIIDVNTQYFEDHGGYEYAKRFYEEAFHFIEKNFGADNIVSAVMHADELNTEVSERLGKDVYHYHLHAMVIPVVEKEIRWSKRCKDPELRGTVKEVIHQVSHSKKWASNIPERDEHGEIVLRKNGKPKFRKSYSILQDEVYDHMTQHGFTGFERGALGSTAVHLDTLQYKIEKDRERLAEIEGRIEQAKLDYEPALEAKRKIEEIDSLGKRNITGKVVLSDKDYHDLTALAKEGLTSRSKIWDMQRGMEYYRDGFMRYATRYENLRDKYEELTEKTRPFLDAMEHFPELVTAFVNKVKDLFTDKAAREQAERERQIAEREKQRAMRKLAKKGRDLER